MQHRLGEQIIVLFFELWKQHACNVSLVCPQAVEV